MSNDVSFSSGPFFNIFCLHENEVFQFIVKYCFFSKF